MHESPGAFASAALALHARGLAVLPVGGENGKRPLVKHWSKWRTQTRETVERLIAQHPEASIAINCGPSRLTVVDADDENALADAEARFGYSPLVVRTPRGGGHLYYRNAGEGCPTRLRVHEGLNVDIKGRGGYVLAPPSRLPHGVPPGAIPELRSSHDAPRSPLEGVLAGDTVPLATTLSLMSYGPLRRPTMTSRRSGRRRIGGTRRCLPSTRRDHCRRQRWTRRWCRLSGG